MSITEDLLLTFSGCSTLGEIEDLVLREQGLTSIQVGSERSHPQRRPNVCRRGCSAACDFRQHLSRTMHWRKLIWPMLCRV